MSATITPRELALELRHTDGGKRIRHYLRSTHPEGHFKWTSWNLTPEVADSVREHFTHGKGSVSGRTVVLTAAMLDPAHAEASGVSANSDAIDWSDLGSLRVAGFQGFLPVRQLAGSPALIPNERGVYVWIRESKAEPEFLEVGTGGHFKGRNPNVPIDELRNNWVDGSAVVYIGKAGDPGSSSTLRQRLGQYLKFGAGAAVGHWGGRYVWQLADSSDLLIAWLPLPDGHPSSVESELIDEFRVQFGERPFANLTK